MSYSAALRIYRTLYSLCEIQRLAYQQEELRCSKDVLHFYLCCLKFVVGWSNLFPPAKLSKKRVSTRAMYGNPYHSIVAHMADLFRIVSLRSIVAEGNERFFQTIR